MKHLLLSICFLFVYFIGQAQAPNISYSTPQTYTAGTAITSLAPVNSGGAVPAIIPGTVSTFAGSTTPGFVNGTGTAARFNDPAGVTVDVSGNVYVADQLNNSIRKITPAGVVTTLAGSSSFGFSDGTGAAASFWAPAGVAVDASGNVYVADQLGSTIRKITPAGVVTTLAGSIMPGSSNGTGSAAKFNHPTGIAVDASGNIYVGDSGNNMIRKITPAGVVTTFAGSGIEGSSDGTGTAASFFGPHGVAIDALGNVYVADTGNDMIRKITPAGLVTTLAGSGSFGYSDGTGTAAQFNSPTGIAVDASGNVYVADQFNHRIRKITPAGMVTTLAGSDSYGSSNGIGTAASFDFPYGVAVDASENVYVTDWRGNMVRKISPYGYSVSPSLPEGLSFNATTGIISGTPKVATPLKVYTVTGKNSGGSSTTTIRITVNGTPVVNTQTVTSITATTATIDGIISNTGTPGPTAHGICWNTTGLPTIADSKVDKGATSATGVFTATMTSLTPGTTYYVRAFVTNSIGTSYGNGLMFTTLLTPPNISYSSPKTYIVGTAITSLVPVNSGGAMPANLSCTVSTFAGSTDSGSFDGTGPVAKFRTPTGVAVDALGNVYVADQYYNKIRKITPAGVVTTLAGSTSSGSSDGTGTAARFNHPTGVAVDVSGNVYVADRDNNKIRKITSEGVVTTLAGSGSPSLSDGTGNTAAFDSPSGVAVDASGNVYVADKDNNLIRKVTATGVVTTLTGSQSYGSVYERGKALGFKYPTGVAVDAFGNIYVANWGSSSIRKVTPSGVVTTLAGSGSNGSSDGTGTAAKFDGLFGLAIDVSGNVYVADSGNNKIRRITPTGVVTTFAGSGSSGSSNGTGTAAKFDNPSGVAVDVSGNVYVADSENDMIRIISSYGYTINSALPEGLYFDRTTGIISGTPLEVSPLTLYTITATNNGGSSTTNVSIAVNGTPTVNTQAITSVAATTATVNSIIAKLGAPNPTAYGICWNTTDMPTIANSKVDKGAISATGVFTATMTSLTPGTTYYIRAYATNSVGTSYGDGVMLTTTKTPPNISYSTSQTYTVGTAIPILAPDNGGGVVPANIPGTVSTLAGSDSPGFSNATGTAARFYYPSGVAVDASGNLYVADKANNRIRKITSSGIVTTLAGSGVSGFLDGNSTVAKFDAPTGVAIDSFGNVYVADSGNDMVRKITPAGVVTTLAGNGYSGSSDGIGTLARFYYPAGVAVDVWGNVFVADRDNHKIRKITPEGVVTTLAGDGSRGSTDGTGPAAKFDYPEGIAIDASGNVYVSDNHSIRKITPAGVVTTLAGSGSYGSSDGTGTAAKFNNPSGVTVDASGNVYVADSDNNRIRKITPAGVVTTLAGSGILGFSDGLDTVAKFDSPKGVAVDASGNVYIADCSNNMIRKISNEGYAISSSLPEGLSFDAATGIISGTPLEASPLTEYTVKATNNGGNSTTTIKITVIGPPTVITQIVSGITATTAAVNGIISNLGTTSPTAHGICWNTTGMPTTTDSKVDNGTASETGLFSAIMTSLTPGTNYFVRTFATNTQGIVYGDEVMFTTLQTPPNFNYSTPQTYIVGIAIPPLAPIISGGAISANMPCTVSTLAGSTTSGSSDGTGIVAMFNNPLGVAIDAAGNVYVADTDNHKIRKITPEGEVTTLAGNGSAGSSNGNGTEARFRDPSGVALDASGNVYVADSGNNMIRKITPEGVVTTLAGGSAGSSDGPGTEAKFSHPEGIAVDASGNVYVADSWNHRIRKITPSGVVSTLAGSRISGSSDGNGIAASFNFPSGVAVDASGNVYVAEGHNQIIRKITPSGGVTTLAGGGSSGSSDGIGTAARFKGPTGVAVDASGNVYVADYGNNKIRKITPSREVTTLAGTGNSGSSNGLGTVATFYHPSGVAVDALGNVYVAGSGNNMIRKITSYGYIIKPLLPEGLSIDANTGIISGTPLESSPLTAYAITGTNTGGSGTISISFTVIGPPVVNTQVVSSITKTTASVNSVISNFGTTTPIAHGICWNITGSPTTADSKVDEGAASATGVFTATMKNLTPGTIYYVRAFATNSVGTGYGDEVIFSTLQTPPNINYSTPHTYTVGTAIPSLVPVNSGGAVPTNVPGVVTIAGSTTSGLSNGTGTAARFKHPTGVAVDAHGNVYLADQYNNMIRKITSAGVVTTLAGSANSGSSDGTGTAAKFGIPSGVAVDVYGNIYVSDVYYHTIRKITPVGVVTTLARYNSGSYNGTGAVGVAADASGNVYVADQLNHMIRKITPQNVVTNLAGSGSKGSNDGIGSSASFNNPTGVALDTSGNVYVADSYNHMIRKITPTGVVTTLAGCGSSGCSDGTGINAYLDTPTGVAVDASGNVYVADQMNHKIRKITTEGVVTTLAGNGNSGSHDGPVAEATFYLPSGVAVDASGNIFVADTNNNNVRMISPYGYTISPFLPEGLSFDATTGIISGTPLESSPLTEYTVTATNRGGSNATTISITVIGPPIVNTQAVTNISTGTATANGEITYLGITRPTSHGICWNTKGSPTIADRKVDNGAASATGVFAVSMTTLTPHTTYYVRTFAVNTQGIVYGDEVMFTTLQNPPNISYSAPFTYTAGTAIIPLVPINSGGEVPANVPGAVSTFAGSTTHGSSNGTGTAAQFDSPTELAVDASGNVYLADQGNNMIRKITPTGVVTTLAGGGSHGSYDGVGIAARFFNPTGVAVDALRNVYVADPGNHKIRKITPAGVVTTLAGNGSTGSTNGTGSSARFNSPTSVAVDVSGNIYVADCDNNMIRKITPAGVVTTLAGNGSPGSTDGTGPAAKFNDPSGVAVDDSGNVYVADAGNYRIRKVTPDGVVTTLAGTGSFGYSDGNGAAAQFYTPTAVAVDASGNVNVVDLWNNKIRKITPAGVVTTLVDNGSPASDTAALVGYPAGVAVDASGNVYMSDHVSNSIKKISFLGYAISPSLPVGLNFDATTGIISGTPLVVSTKSANGGIGANSGEQLRRNRTDLSLLTEHTVTATNNGGSSTTTVSITVIDMTVGIDNLESKGALAAYPVHNTEIRVKGEVSRNAIATLYDALGRVILVKKLEEGSLNIIPTSGIKTGVYLLFVKDNERMQNFKMLIKE
jgi:sugar lactone lactonase YvrE